jgi:hypothetical protein
LVNGTVVMSADQNGVHAGPGMTGTPLAYGTFSSTGTKASGSSNLSCTWDSTNVRYECTITGVDYDIWNYITNVTTIGGFAVPGLNSLSGTMWIYFYGTAANTMQPSGFSVTVYTP